MMMEPLRQNQNIIERTTIRQVFSCLFFLQAGDLEAEETRQALDCNFSYN